MALAHLQKVLFFTRAEDEEALMDVLQASGRVHLDDGDAVLPEDALPEFDRAPAGRALEKRMADVQKRLQTLDAAIKALSPYEHREGIAARFMQARALATLEEFYAFADYDETPITNQVVELSQRQRSLEAELSTLVQQRRRLTVFERVTTPLQAFSDTSRCFVEVFSAPGSRWETQREELADALGDDGHVGLLGRQRDRVLVAVVGRHRVRSSFTSWLDRHPVQRLEAAGARGTVQDLIGQVESEAAKREQQLMEVEEARAALASHLPMLREAYDFWSTRLDQLQKTELLRESRYMAVAGGWIRAEDVTPLQARFERRGLAVHTVVTEPDEDDEPPVEYDNAPAVRPFEFVSDLYSRPSYREIDPTPYLAGFFAFFVGICLTDAGYGLVLTLATVAALKWAPGLEGSSRKLVRILFYCGLCTVGVGLLTGGFFGFTAEVLPGPLRGLQHVVVINPVEDQMGFLIFTLSLGVLQVTFGIGLKFWWNLRHHHIAEAWLDQGPWLLLIAAVIALLVARFTGALWLGTAGYAMMIAAGSIILIFAGRGAGGAFKRLASGLFSLYQVSGLFGDVLSYVRLFALGLATGVIASVVNFIAQLLLGVPYVGVVLMLLVLVAGHLVNLAINALGGFIHTTRLQFVEFFGKFYEGGGRPFEAFRLKTRYTQLLDQA